MNKKSIKAHVSRLFIRKFLSVATKLSRVVRKLAFRICKKQRCRSAVRYRTADLHLRFCYIDSSIPFLPKTEAMHCGCIARFVSDLVGNFKGKFSCNGDAKYKKRETGLCQKYLLLFLKRVLKFEI